MIFKNNNINKLMIIKKLLYILEKLGIEIKKL
jgi:hypothetical protein